MSWPENTPKDAELANGAMQGKNSGREIGYDGPCPPSGTHRYFIKLYALDTILDLGSGAEQGACFESHAGTRSGAKRVNGNIQQIRLSSELHDNKTEQTTGHYIGPAARGLWSRHSTRGNRSTGGDGSTAIHTRASAGRHGCSGCGIENEQFRSALPITRPKP